MDIPEDIQMRSTIRGGSVFYFVEDTFVGNKPHYFVVLNQNPRADSVIILVTAVTMDISVLERKERMGRGMDTLVDVTPQQCQIFDRVTLFDCNEVIEKPMAVLIEKLGKKHCKAVGWFQVKSSTNCELGHGQADSCLVK